MQITEELLWRYIDNDCDADEREAIRSRLATDPDIRAQYCDLLSYHTRFGDLLASDLVSRPAPRAVALSKSADELRRVYDAFGSLRHN